jgi:hypothetical protein
MVVFIFLINQFASDGSLTVWQFLLVGASGTLAP